jgi:hypothetical protein
MVYKYFLKKFEKNSLKLKIFLKIFSSVWRAICCFLLADLVLGNVNLTCEFYQYGSYYACQVFGAKFPTENEIVKFSGYHLHDDQDDDLVTMLAFYQSSVNYIPANLFAQFKNLKFLSCDSCFLKKIEQSSFKDADNMEVFVSKIGNLKVLENDLFLHSKKLKIVEMPGNLIMALQEKAFGGLSNLLQLKLFHNLISDLPTGIFDDLTSLEYLDLNFNRIEILPADLFKFNGNLNDLRLSNNRIVVVDQGLIDHLTKISYIDFVNNDCTNFYEIEISSNLTSIFKENVSECTEENRFENLLELKIEEVESLQALNRSLHNEILELQKNNEEAWRASNDNLFAELEKNFEELSLKTLEVETLKVTNANLTNEISILREENSELEKVHGDLENLKSLNENLTKDGLRFIAINKNLSSEMNDWIKMTENLTSEVARWKELHDNLTLFTNDLEKENDNLIAEIEGFENLKVLNENLTSEVKLLKQWNQNLTNEVKKLNASNENLKIELEKWKGENEKLTKDLNKLNITNENLTIDLEKKSENSTKKPLQMSEEKFREEIGILKNTIVALTAENEALKESQKSAETRDVDYQKRLIECNTDYQTLRSEFESIMLTIRGIRKPFIDDEKK